MNENEFIKEIRVLQQIADRAMAGEEVYCPKCGELLIINKLGSGKHPSVFCPNNDFKVMIDYKGNNVIENLGLDKK
ncbi:hypothetical protein J25TS5_36820 [Paenibacillus faecis]|uniref:Uncharacterized protein n=1 Tax=Paenibacillus faecis TaxID=862114 RepID=A0A5D0CLN3_9BACL|nr:MULTISPECIES: hypothetical protein [Paenibacillus]MCA1294972.1 hypothetical protein [Paenibacillus sp. alder61]TYA10761.1 hypothetical protein FRY98_23560 [Paenibacillus faecis]GIO86750.1 hypothetical protein J25TS5_36820 [Paenibacillus faecis]